MTTTGPLDNTAAIPAGPDPVMTDAERAFAALDFVQRTRLLRQVFEALEFDENGDPGRVRVSDTPRTLRELFAQYGVTFTNPDAVTRCALCARWITQRADDYLDRDGFSTCIHSGEYRPHTPSHTATD